MTLPNSWDIESALINLLQADAELQALMPDGVSYGLGKSGDKQYVSVALLEARGEDVFGTRAIEDNVYTVKAVGLSTVTTEAELKAAAYRIDQLLQDQSLTVNGYSFGDMARYLPNARIRFDEPIPNNPATVWLHGGGNYRVRVSLPNA